MLDSGMGVTGVKAENISKGSPRFSTESKLFMGPGTRRRPADHQSGAFSSNANSSEIHKFGQALLDKVKESENP
jgi:hypothetical protein